MTVSMNPKPTLTALPEDTVANMTPQLKLLYEVFMAGRKLSKLTAMTTLGVGSLTTRVSELRKLGLNVVAKWEGDHFDKRYKSYALAKPEEPTAP